jgi:hypothetical protein
MDQILPGIYHWATHDDETDGPVSSYYVEPAGALIDPMVPDDGLEAFAGLTRPQQAILTNHGHLRHSERFRDAFDCVVRGAAKGLDEHLPGADVRAFEFGDEVAPGVVAVEIGVFRADETALHVAHGEGAVAFGDALVRPGGGSLAYPSDDDLGAHPLRKRKGLKEAFRGLLLRDFDALLFAHGEPLTNHGKAALREFVEVPVEYPEYGPFA